MSRNQQLIGAAVGCAPAYRLAVLSKSPLKVNRAAKVRSANGRRLLAAVVATCAALAGGASAADFAWTAGTGFFHTAGNWSPSGPPGTADGAIFNRSDTYDVLWDSVTGNRTNASLLVSGGNVTFRRSASGTAFTYTHSGNATIQNGATLNLGASGMPHRLVSNGGLQVNHGTLNVRFGSQVSANAVGLGQFDLLLGPLASRR